MYQEDGIEPVENQAQEPEDQGMDQEEEELYAEDFGQECEEEGRAPRLLATPYVPSREEVDEHEVAHWPYRAWCPDCVRGRGRVRAHRSLHDYARESGEPMIVGDYCYLWQGPRR